MIDALLQLALGVAGALAIFSLWRWLAMAPEADGGLPGRWRSAVLLALAATALVGFGTVVAIAVASENPFGVFPGLGLAVVAILAGRDGVRAWARA